MLSFSNGMCSNNWNDETEKKYIEKTFHTQNSQKQPVGSVNSRKKKTIKYIYTFYYFF